MAFPDPTKPFILDTDASNAGIGAVLSQESDGVEHVVAYASRALSKQERKYATTKKELLSMVTFTMYFKHYLLGKKFILHTDHNSLGWLHNFQGMEGQLARWVEQLASFQYRIVHRPGKLHTSADALSRLPAFTDALPQVGQNQMPLASGDQQLQDPSVCAVQEERPRTQAGWEFVDDEVAKAQREDDELQQLIDLKIRGLAISENSPLLKYSPVWSQLQIRDSCLVRAPPANTDAASQVQVVLPQVLVPKVLAQLHDSLTGGHLVIQKL